MSDSLKLFTKTGCPWCADAKGWLDRHGYKYEEFDVRQNAGAFEEMKKLSGQTLAPTLVAGDNILPDFGTPELEEFVERHSIKP